ncbi:MAG: hypothetical protein QXZ70_04740 [Candidatus Bathyarchaeia archaeon]
MQPPPLTFMDAGVLLTVAAIVLLITVELTSAYYGVTNLTINRKNLKRATLIVSVGFLITAAIRIATILA